MGRSDGVGVTNTAGLAVRTTEGDGVGLGVADTEALVVVVAVVDAVGVVVLAVWSLLVNEVHPAITIEATIISATTPNHSFLIRITYYDTELKEYTAVRA